ncbi:CRAL-TRIO domain-containing protein [Gaertneriomyces semiglobifer]|nr:CRAL-TRIO domain-containing protein [Gaertneriomyces semiglobifer]
MPSQVLAPSAKNTVPIKRLFGTEEDFRDFQSRLIGEPRFKDLDVDRLTEWWQIMFFDTHRGKTDAACDAIERTLKWRNAYGWYNLVNEEFNEETRSGKLYFHKQDKEGNPVMIWRMSRHEASKSSAAVDRTVRFMIWTMEKAIREGRVTIILDRLETGSNNNEGIQFIRSAVTNIQTNLPEIIHKVVIFPTNFILLGVWKVAKTFLDPRVVGKVMFCTSGDYQQVLTEIIDVDSLPKRYGGSADDPLDGADWQNFVAAHPDGELIVV